jgi:drug/metabolite transporter (DMT)-like permease
MLLFAALVAGSFSLGRMAAPHIEPTTLNAVRFIVAAAIVAGLASLSDGWSRQVFAAPWRYVLLAGLYAVYFVAMFEGLKTAEPVSMAAVFTTNPALTAVFGYFIVAQITTARMALAIVIGAIGALWVIFQGDPAAARAFEIGRGETIYFWGCFGHALYSPMLRRLNRGENALAFNACVLAVGAVILSLWAGRDLVQADFDALPGIVWVTIAYTAVFATALSLLCVRYATLRLPSAKVMAYTYLVPSFVILWELALGHGAPALLVVPGIGLTGLALILLLKDE